MVLARRLCRDRAGGMARHAPGRTTTIGCERGCWTPALVMTRTEELLDRIRALLIVFIIGLVLSGLTAFPLETELRWLTGLLGADASTGPSEVQGILQWLVTVRDALTET